MKRSLGLFFLVVLFIIPQSVHAGHYFMETMRQNSTVVKEESCSNDKTKIEHRLVKMERVEILLTLVILEPDAISRESQFYSEKNKDFYSLIFYRMSVVQDMTQVTHLMKKVRSSELEKLTASQWLKKMQMADPNAAKSLTKQPGSDCKIIYEAASH